MLICAIKMLIYALDLVLSTILTELSLSMRAEFLLKIVKSIDFKKHSLPRMTRTDNCNTRLVNFPAKTVFVKILNCV